MIGLFFIADVCHKDIIKHFIIFLNKDTHTLLSIFIFWIQRATQPPGRFMAWSFACWEVILSNTGDNIINIRHHLMRRRKKNICCPGKMENYSKSFFFFLLHWEYLR